MEIGIIGLKQSGKTTLFEVLTGADESLLTDRTVGKTKTHLAVVPVPDDRLETIHKISKSKKFTPISIKFIDMAGMEQFGESRRHASSLDFTPVAQSDIFLEVVRAFRSDVVAHPLSSLDPIRDVERIESELIQRDLHIAENRLSHLKKAVSKKSSLLEQQEVNILERCIESLTQSVPLRNETLTPDETKCIRGYEFLSLKPVLRVLNIDDRQLDDTETIQQQYESLAHQPQSGFVMINAKLERELQQLPDDERRMFIDELQISVLARDQVIQEAYNLLGLITYYTTSDPESRAWAIPRNTRAVKAAGSVHSDMERGFIRAETVHYDDLSREGAYAKCKEKGLLRFEGKDYIVMDGDIILFHFNV